MFMQQCFSKDSFGFTHAWSKDHFHLVNCILSEFQKKALIRRFMFLVFHTTNNFLMVLDCSTLSIT